MFFILNLFFYRINVNHSHKMIGKYFVRVSQKQNQKCYVVKLKMFTLLAAKSFNYACIITFIHSWLFFICTLSKENCFRRTFCLIP